MFGVLVGLAVAFRRDGPSHKRLMYLATINLLQAVIVRIPAAVLYDPEQMTTFLLAYTFIAPLVVWDIATLRRIIRQRYGVAWVLFVAAGSSVALWNSGLAYGREMRRRSRGLNDCCPFGAQLTIPALASFGLVENLFGTAGMPR